MSDGAHVPSASTPFYALSTPSVCVRVPWVRKGARCMIHCCNPNPPTGLTGERETRYSTGGVCFFFSFLGEMLRFGLFGESWAFTGVRSLHSPLLWSRRDVLMLHL